MGNGRISTAQSEGKLFPVAYFLFSGFSPFSDLRHFAFFIRPFAADRALPDLIFQHGVVGGAGAPKLLPGEKLPDVDQGEGDAENNENNG